MKRERITLPNYSFEFLVVILKQLILRSSLVPKLYFVIVGTYIITPNNLNIKYNEFT